MTGCELVAVVALTFTRTATHAQPVKKVCLAALIRRARREGAVVIDMRDGRRGRVLVYQDRVLLVTTRRGK